MCLLQGPRCGNRLFLRLCRDAGLVCSPVSKDLIYTALPFVSLNMAKPHAGMSSASLWGLAGVYQNQLCLGSGICAPLCPFQKEPSVSSRLGPDCLGSSGMRYLNCSLSGAERGVEHSPFWTILCQGTSQVGKLALGTADQLEIPYLNSGAWEWRPCYFWQALFFLPPVLSSSLILFVFQVH